ncbi:MAG TPA: Hpt domain-containing protein [Mycobacteriales bacterium]|nr:Hpt domain-containing protein [Mycobacteriales bacterium]
MPEEPVLDDRIVDGLRRLGDEVLREIAHLWFDNLEPGLDAMRTALAGEDRPALTAAAHTLRGSAANVGAARLAAGCAALELAAKDRPTSDLQGLFDAVAAEAASAHDAMAKVAAEPSA